MPHKDDTILPEDTLEHLFGDEIRAGGSKLKKDARFEKFMEALNDLRKTALRHRLDIGEQLMIISLKFDGWSWNDIPYGRIEEVKKYLSENAWRKTQILQPEMHKKLMELPDSIQGAAEYKKMFAKHLGTEVANKPRDVPYYMKD